MVLLPYMLPENKQTYTYRALSDQTPFKDQVRSLFKSYRAFVLFAAIISIVFIGPFIVSGFFTILIGLEYGNPASVIFGLVFIIVPLLMLLGGLWGIVHLFQRDAKSIQFAKDNNITLLQNIINPPYNGTLFNQGGIRVISLGYVLQQTPHIEVGNLTFTSNSDNRNSTVYGYIKLELAKNLPHVVLDSVKNNTYGPSILVSFANNQKLSLEGDFNSFYTVYAPQGYEQDALYLLTPDVMNALTQLAKSYDIEIIDNQVYLYRYGAIDLASEQEIKEVLATINVIQKEIGKQSEMYKDDTVPTQAGNIVSASGQRLNKKFNVAGVITAVIILAMTVAFSYLWMFTT